MKRVLIAVPCGTMVHADFMESLCNLDKNIMGAVTCELKLIKTSCLLASRHELVYYAIARDFTHILFLDSDMTFPPGTLKELILADKQVIAANYPTRRGFIEPTALLLGHQRHPMTDTHKIRKVEKVGFGCILLDLEVFKAISLPWFEFTWNLTEGYYMSEDYVFCDKLTAAGIPIYVHNELSCRVGHIGEKTYTHRDCK